MPEWIVVVILGLVEGVTEFLPISSTGHLLIVQEWLHPRQTPVFNTVIQCGAVIAVLVAFAERVRQMAFHWRDHATRAYIFKLAAAFLVTGTGGLILKTAGLGLPETAAPVAWATLTGGILIIVVEKLIRGQQLQDQISWPIAIAIGLAQLVAAIFPGASRSGTTILMALILGVSRPAATEFSFLLGIPTLFAAGGLHLGEALAQEDSPDLERWDLLLLGTAVSAVTAFLAVKWLLRFVQSHTFVGFGWYRIALGALILVLAG